MTKTTSDPLEALGQSLKNLEGMKKHHESFLPGIQEDWDRAQQAYKAAREHYEGRLAEIANVEEGIMRHRKAIAVLKPQEFHVPEQGMVDADEARTTHFGLHIIGCKDHHHFGSCES